MLCTPNKVDALYFSFQIIDSLLEIQKKIKSSLSGKKKAAQLYEKCRFPSVLLQ